MRASIAQVTKALNEAAAKKGFRCVPVSWEDAQRGTVGGQLSCWGGNISDVRLWEKSGKLLYTLRTENWNERLGYVSTKDVAVVVGNHVRGGQAPVPITLETYLKNFKEYAGYAGVTKDTLHAEGVDQLATIRFQTVFLPIADDEATMFCTEVYNYNTRSDSDPRNTQLLCTAQGTSVQQDGSGAKKVFLHSVDGGGKVHRYWMEAERSRHKVGGEQKETDEEMQEAASRGKATAIHIGTRAMGTRFNVQMLVQIPTKQKERRGGGGFGALSGFGYDNGVLSGGGFGGVPYSGPVFNAPVSMCSNFSCPPQAPSYAFGVGGDGRGPSAPFFRCQAPAPKVGVSNAARVSRGTEEDVWPGVDNKEPERDPSQHITITVTMYYTCAGGVPSKEDVESCLEDLDNLYSKCPSDKKLVDCTEVTAELTVKNTMDIKEKVTTQPYVPPTHAPVRSVFPE